MLKERHKKDMYERKSVNIYVCDDLQTYVERNCWYKREVTFEALQGIFFCKIYF